jgi:RimJ/RimL family protein N-acetyltransferase
MPGEIVTSTDRMTLRRFTMSDVDLLYELDGDPHVMRHLSRTQTPREFIESSLIPRLLQEYEQSDNCGCWAATSKLTDEFIGWFSLRGPGTGTPAGLELGYRLRTACWGQGLATEGGRALIDRAFRETGIEKVWAQTMAVNTESRLVMEKCGMTYIRTVHVHFDDPLPGTEQGEVEYAITREQWMG